MTLALPAPADAIAYVAPKRRAPAYKVEMERARAEYEPMISSLSQSLQGRLQKYFDALEGNYVYRSKNKEVKARTYRKRLEFAKKELESIQAHIQLSRKYGKMEDTTALEISNYTQQIYNEAVKKNRYAKSHNLTRTTQGRTMKSNLATLDSKVIDAPLQKQDADSKYWFYFDKEGEWRSSTMRGLQIMKMMPNVPIPFNALPDQPIYPPAQRPMSRLDLVDALPQTPVPQKKTGWKKWLALAACGVGLLGGAAYGVKNYVDESLSEIANHLYISHYHPDAAQLLIKDSHQ